MFDAKSLLEALMRGAQPAPSAQAQSGGGLADILGQILKPGAGGQGGGLGDILGKMMPSGGGQAGAAPQAPGAAGGLEEMLRKLMPQGGGAPSSSQPSSGGGLGDIFGQLQKQLGQAGQGSASPGGQAQQGGGGLLEILAQVLGQATSGAKEGAGKLNEMTGAGQHARDAIGQATGKSPEDLLAQLQELIKGNPGAATAGLGGLGAVVLGTRTGRSVAASAAKLGALALIGGLAFKAYQNYAQGRPLVSGNDDGRLLSEPAPQGSGFEPAAISNETATLYIRAMISAAASDGRIDASEQQRVLGSLQQAGIEDAAQTFLKQELQKPATIDDLAEGVRTPAEAVQVYTAARLAIDPDTHEENEFLAGLAERLGIDAKLVAHIDATAVAVV